MKTIITAILIAFALYACDDLEKGCLETQDAGYVTDSMTICLYPQTTDTIPYQSEPIQGVLGTFPIQYEIAALHDSTGQSVPGEIQSQVRSVLNAVIQIERNHTIPVGRYGIDLQISNMHGSVTLKDIFTLIVVSEDE